MLSLSPSAFSQIALLDDAYVVNASASKNFGNATTLKIANGVSDGYLRFDLAGAMPPGTPLVAKATLKVFIANKKGVSGELGVHESSTNLEELQLNVSTLVVGDLITTKTPAKNNWLEFDVTDYVAANQANPAIAFALRGTAGLNVNLDSKENKATSHAAVLDIEWSNVNGLTDASNNTAQGKNALGLNTTGLNNSAYGANALFSNTTGNNNTANGVNTLLNNTTGNENTAYGMQALSVNNSGSGNTATGFQALFSNTSGEGNTANGKLALFANSTGANNTATGGGALQLNSTGVNNTANGVVSLVNNSTGDSNTAIGSASLFTNTVGDGNTAIGANALQLNSIGNSNSAYGFTTLSANTTGVNNTGIGVQALGLNITGSNNSALGANSDVTSANLSNATAIGAGAKVNASNKVRIGNSDVTVIEGPVAFTTPSDQRFKSQIKDLPIGLSFITQLRPVEYIRTNNQAKTKEWGLIAQELKQTLVDAGYKDAGIVQEDSSKDQYLTVRYNDLLAPMIKAIQEQQKTIEALSKKIEVLEKQQSSTATK